MSDLDELGIHRASYRTDQEPAIIALLNAVKISWKGELVPEESPLWGEGQPRLSRGGRQSA